MRKEECGMQERKCKKNLNIFTTHTWLAKYKKFLIVLLFRLVNRITLLLTQKDKCGYGGTITVDNLVWDTRISYLRQFGMNHCHRFGCFKEQSLQEMHTIFN